MAPCEPYRLHGHLRWRSARYDLLIFERGVLRSKHGDGGVCGGTEAPASIANVLRRRTLGDCILGSALENLLHKGSLAWGESAFEPERSVSRSHLQFPTLILCMLFTHQLKAAELWLLIRSLWFLAYTYFPSSVSKSCFRKARL